MKLRKQNSYIKVYNRMKFTRRVLKVRDVYELKKKTEIKNFFTYICKAHYADLNTST